MEMGRQRDPEGGDISEPDEALEEGEAVPAEVRLLRELLGSSSRTNLELSIYDGSLKVEKLIDYINTMDKYFEYEEIEERKRVKCVVIRLKGHPALWWDNVQDE